MLEIEVRPRTEVVAFLHSELREIKPHIPAQWPTNALFKADLDLDSLDLVELIARIEQRYRVLIPDTELEHFMSVDAIADYLCKRAAS